LSYDVYTFRIYALASSITLYVQDDREDKNMSELMQSYLDMFVYEYVTCA